MFRCACCNSLGSWRSGLLAIAFAALVAWAFMLAPAQLGFVPRSDDTTSRALDLFTITMAPLWVALGMAEGRRGRCRRAPRQE